MKKYPDLIDRMISEFEITRDEALRVRRAFVKARDEYAKDYAGHESFSIVKGLEAAAKVLDDAGFRTYGVEGNCGQSFQDGYRNPPTNGESIVEFLNRGDTYAVTLVYDYQWRGGQLRVCSWGDIVEAAERRYGRIAE